MKALSLFTGYGGIDLALKDYITETIAYVEIEEYAQKIITYRMADGSLPRAAILADVKNVEGEIGDCDIIYGGFPCQDISVAGNGKGLAGERSGLFFEIIRLTKEIRPSFVFLENVPAIRTRGLEQVIKAFTEVGYDCRWTCLSAASVGAPHKRERWFLLAHSNRAELRPVTKCESASEYGNDGQKESMAYSNRPGFQTTRSELKTTRIEQCSDVAKSVRPRLERFAESEVQGPWESRRFKASDSSIFNGSHWATEPSVGRVANGVAFRVDRIKALGNGVVPLQVRTAFEVLIGIK